MNVLNSIARADSNTLRLSLIFCAILNLQGFVQNKILDIRYRIQTLKKFIGFISFAIKLAGIILIVLSSHLFVFKVEARMMSSFKALTMENEGGVFANNILKLSSNSIGLHTNSDYISVNESTFEQTQLPSDLSRVSVMATNEIVTQTFSESDLNVSSDLIREIPNGSDTMMVANADPLPLLEITAPSNPTIESTGIVNFIISTSASTNPGLLRVRYDPSEVDGDFLNQNAPLSQEVPVSRVVRFSGSSGSFKGTLRVRIHDDMVAESNGKIQVTLLADTASPATYQIRMDGQKPQWQRFWMMNRFRF